MGRSCRLREISEKLHRADLSTVERAEMLASPDRAW